MTASVRGEIKPRPRAASPPAVGRVSGRAEHPVALDQHCVAAAASQEAEVSWSATCGFARSGWYSRVRGIRWFFGDYYGDPPVAGQAAPHAAWSGPR